MDTHLCLLNDLTSCVNTIGGYRCQCDPGYDVISTTNDRSEEIFICVGMHRNSYLDQFLFYFSFDFSVFMVDLDALNISNS